MSQYADAGPIAQPDDFSVCQNLDPEALAAQPNSFCYCKDCEVGGMRRAGREWCHCPGCNDCEKFPQSLPCDTCDPDDPTLELETWLDCYCSKTENEDFKGFCCNDSMPISRRAADPRCVAICQKFPQTEGCEGQENVDCKALEPAFL